MRLSLPHATVVGANDPSWKRLYELTCGAKNSVSSRMQAIWPATNRSNSVWSFPNAFSPSSPASEQWMWQELPSASSHLAMNVSAIPSCAAISLAPVL